MDKKIVIHYDHSSAEYKSCGEVIDLVKINTPLIHTNCLNFFKQSMYYDKGYEVVVCKKDGSYISLEKLITKQYTYTSKYIRRANNVYKLLMAGAFKFEMPDLRYKPDNVSQIYIGIDWGVGNNEK